MRLATVSLQPKQQGVHGTRRASDRQYVLIFFTDFSKKSMVLIHFANLRKSGNENLTSPSCSACRKMVFSTIYIYMYKILFLELVCQCSTD